MIQKLTLLSYILIMLSVLGAPANAKQSETLLKIAIVALSDNYEIRQDLENRIVNKLLANHYDAIASHILIKDISNIRDPKLRHKLYANGIHGALLLRAIDVGEKASIISSGEYVSPRVYSSIQEFISDERGGDFDSRAVVQVSAFMLSEHRATSFWSGVVWLDAPVETRQEGFEKLAELVVFNLNAARSYMRQRMGLAPIIK